MRIAFLTMAEQAESLADDELAARCLRRKGHTVEWVIWHQADVPWRRYDGLVLRSPFDYIDDVQRFLQALERMESVTNVFNGLPWVRWNFDKRYLLALAQRGVAVVPTRCMDALTAEVVEEVRHDLGGGELIVKPSVGASGRAVQRLPLDVGKERLDAMSRQAEGAWLVQPFMPGVLEEGELSLMFFDGQLSHAVQKVPRRGSFLVQEEHGGSTRALAPPREALLLAQRTLEASAACVGADGPPLYSRIDMVRGADGAYQVMEVEVIEPQLFLGHDDGAAARFAAAIEDRLETSS